MLHMKSNLEVSISNDLVAQDNQTLVSWQYITVPLKKKPLGFKDHRDCAIFDHNRCF